MGQEDENVWPASAASFREALDNLAACCQIIGPDGRFLYVNQALAGRFRCPLREIPSRTITEVFPGIESTPILNALQQCRKDRLARRIDAELAFPDGSGGWFQHHFSPVPEGVCILSLEIGERRPNEEASRQTETLGNAIIESIPGAFYVLDQAGRYARWNAYQRDEIIGKPEEEVAGTNAIDTIHPDDRELIRAKIANVLGNGAVEAVEGRVLLRGGPAYRWLLMTGRRLLADGRPFLVGIGVDITERKQAEAALRENERLLRLIADNVRDTIWLMDLGMRPTWISPSVVKTRGYTLEELAELPMEKHLTPDSLVRMLELAAVHLTPEHLADPKAEIVASTELEYCRKDGSTFWADSVVALLRDEEGRPSGYLGVGRDITERKRAEEDLRRRENLLQKVFEILPVGLWFADKNGKLLRGNPAGVGIWGAEPRLPMSEYGVFKAWRLPAHEPVAPDDHALARTIREGVTVLDELLEIESFDGKHKTILNSTAPVLDENGNIEGAIVVNLDVTDRRALEDQLRQAQKMESVGRLAGGVAHDFNNMLAVILGHTELAMRTVVPTDPLRDHLREIYNAAQRSANITRQLLAFARKQTIVPRVLDLNEAVEGMLKMLQRLIGEDIHLVWRPARTRRPVWMDPSQLDQILANLCVNARDAIAGVGILTIETSALTFDEADCVEHPGFVPGDFVRLMVSDNGCGMDRETLDHLFEPFFTTKGQGQGTGLGLATVYGIVKQNGGFLDVESVPGEGTTFRIYLPAHQGGGVREPVEPAEATPRVRESKTVLVVEDEPAILAMTRAMLEQMGYTVLSAGTPRRAIELSRRRTGEIHLLMTDVVMPEMNGNRLAQELSSLCPGIRVLFVSGYPASVIAQHGVLNEGVHFLQKPFSMQDLAAGVARALREDR